MDCWSRGICGAGGPPEAAERARARRWDFAARRRCFLDFAGRGGGNGLLA